MILTLAEIKEILLNNPSAKSLQDAVIYSKKLQKHIYGTELKDSFSYIQGFEKPEYMKNVRSKYAISNKHIFAQLAKPIDKVFTAKGGSVYYNVDASDEKKITAILSNVSNGISIKKWLQNKWLPHYLDDPNGMIFLEVSAGTILPTYKGSCDIYSLKLKGNNYEWVVFKVSNEDKKKAGFVGGEAIYRVVDDSFDYWVELKNGEVFVIQKHTFPNPFTYVPGISNSDIEDPNSDGKHFLSLYDEVLEIAEHYLNTSSIKISWEFKHGFPKYWEFADLGSCTTCKGTKYVEGKICPTCQGSGQQLMLDHTKNKALTPPRNKEGPNIAPHVGGYIEPSKTYYEIATDSMKDLENAIHFTTWGVLKAEQPSKEKRDVTATEKNIDVQPINEKLSSISDTVQKRHKFIIDSIVKVLIDENYEGSNIQYGRRFMIETPDVIWQKYSDARTKGASQSVLDDLLIEYYEGKYSGDPVQLAIQLKLVKVEPFVHYTCAELKGLNPSIEDYTAKLYYSEWLSQVPPGQLLIYKESQLRDELKLFIESKKLLPLFEKPVNVPALN